MRLCGRQALYKFCLWWWLVLLSLLNQDPWVCVGVCVCMHAHAHISSMLVKKDWKKRYKMINNHRKIRSDILSITFLHHFLFLRQGNGLTAVRKLKKKKKKQDGTAHQQHVSTLGKSTLFTCLCVTCLWMVTLLHKKTLVQCKSKLSFLFLFKVSSMDTAWESAHKVDSGEKNFCHSCWYSNSQPFDHESGTLTNKLSRLPVHPHVTAVARKRPRLFCQKCRWQATPRYAYTLDSTEAWVGVYVTIQA